MKIPALTLAFGVSLLAHATVLGTVLWLRHRPVSVAAGLVAGQTLEIVLGQDEVDTILSASPSSTTETTTAAVPVAPPATSELPAAPEPLAATDVSLLSALEELTDPPASPPVREPRAESVAANSADGNKSDEESSDLNPSKSDSSATAANPTGVRYLFNPRPLYPREARRHKQEGVVVLAVQVTSDGSPEQIKIQHGSGFPVLDAAAQEAVRSWRFTPARIGPVAVGSSIEIPIRFRLIAAVSANE